MTVAWEDAQASTRPLLTHQTSLRTFDLMLGVSGARAQRVFTEEAFAALRRTGTPRVPALSRTSPCYRFNYGPHGGVVEASSMPYADEIVQRIWEKATAVESYDSTRFRKDRCGAWIRRDAYGDRDSIYGWEIDHIEPQSQGGPDTLANLRPLQWKNNTTRDSGRLTCPVRANGNQNIDSG